MQILVMTAKHLSARVSLSFGPILNIIVVLLYRDILDYAPMILAMFFIISLLFLVCRNYVHLCIRVEDV
jgi:hypothetical protein